jgi:hypothetical protein
MTSTLLIVILLVLLVASLPNWPYSTDWGYGPGGAVGAVLAIVLVLALLGRL